MDEHTVHCTLYSLQWNILEKKKTPQEQKNDEDEEEDEERKKKVKSFDSKCEAEVWCIIHKIVERSRIIMNSK